MVREPAVAGQFYPGTQASLKKLVETLTEKTAQRKKAFGVMSPHAGFMYSGKVAGAVFSKVELPDTYIIIGPNHTGKGRPFSITGDGSWVTPLGEVKIDSELAGDLLKRSRLIQDDSTAHSFEHSIETQLPFIQFFNSSFKFIPLILSNARIETYREIANDIADSIKASGKDVLIVASSDMTHYEEQKIVTAKDKEAIKAILELDEAGLLKRIDEFDISMCGYAPTVVMLIAAKKLGAKKAELVKYMTSGDTSGDFSAVVGYAGIIVS